MNTSPKHQQGLTFISLVVIFVFAGFIVLLGFKIGPIYLDHSKVSSALAEIEESPDLQNQTQEEIRASFGKRFNINYVNDVTQDDIKITKYDNYLKVAIEYEVVRPIIGNLSVLVTFNDVIEVGNK